MKEKKIILLTLSCGLFIGAVMTGIAFHLINRDISAPTNVEASVLLTEEQYQFLTNSLIQWELDHLGSIRRRNAWLMLDAMREFEFVEDAPRGQSRVGFATGILELLNVGEIEELNVVRLELGDRGFNDVLVIRIQTISNNDIYYLRYQRSRGLGNVTRDNETGEVIYNSAIHTIRDGQLCEREYIRGPIISCR